MENYVRLVSRSAHTGIIITGFLMLREQKIIDFDFVEDFLPDLSGFPTEHILEANINGKRLAFDTFDGSENMQNEATLEYIKNLDFYFKRSFLSTEINALGEEFSGKIHPLGLFYRVTYPGNPLDKDVKKPSLKQMLLGAKPKTYFTPEVFESAKNDKKSPKVMFFTRLWGDKNNIESAGKRELNLTRIETIKLLKKELKDDFLGGVQDDPLSRALCPELILDGKYTRRDLYLKFMKRCPIAISSEGLHHSINGKIAEAVACGRAIVCEKLYFELPDCGGGFTDGKNYLSFATPDECLEKVRYLLNDPEALKNMQDENRRYYNEYSRPDKMIYHALKVAGVV